LIINSICIITWTQTYTYNLKIKYPQETLPSSLASTAFPSQSAMSHNHPPSSKTQKATTISTLPSLLRKKEDSQSTKIRRTSCWIAGDLSIILTIKKMQYRYVEVGKSTAINQTQLYLKIHSNF
jgi:hypothetical protein